MEKSENIAGNMIIRARRVINFLESEVFLFLCYLSFLNSVNIQAFPFCKEFAYVLMTTSSRN